MIEPDQQGRRITALRLGLLFFIQFGVFVLLHPMPVAQAESDLQELIAQAVVEYDEAMEMPHGESRQAAFSRAQQLFNQAIEANPGDTSSELLLNLGNSALQAEHIGEAIFAFRRALSQDPRNERALQNLSFARSLVPASFYYAKEPSTLGGFLFWERFLSQREIASVSGLSLLLAVLVCCLGVALRRNWIKFCSIPALIVWCLLSSSLVLHRVWVKAPEGVVVNATETLRSADSENAQAILVDPLPDGTEVVILQQLERWVEVRIGGRTGWLRASALKVL